MRPESKPAGFTLVETILVLAVVGLILGAIWLGYSAATHVKRQTIGEQQITDILQTARNYMLQSNENNSCVAAYYGANCPATGNDITATLIGNNLIPDSITSAPNNTFSVEYGTATVRVYNSAANPYGSGPVIGLILTGLQQVDCSDVAGAWAGSPDRITRSGMIGIVIAPAANSIPSDATNLLNGATNGAISSSAITANCVAGTNNINLFFRLNP